MTSTGTIYEIRELPRGVGTSEQVRRWAESHFDRALLILGDSTEALRQHSRFWGAFERTAEPAGLAVRFDGFASPIASVAADDPAVFNQLCEVACEGGATLVLNTKQPSPASFQNMPQSVDSWLVSNCTKSELDPNVEPLHDEAELQTFYSEQGMAFWCPSMLRSAQVFGIRGTSSEIVCAGGVNFVLSSLNYAQIGALATHPAYRKRSYATRVLMTIRSNLATMGIRLCGLFAESPSFYYKRGFSERGRFRFVEFQSDCRSGVSGYR